VDESGTPASRAQRLRWFAASAALLAGVALVAAPAPLAGWLFQSSLCRAAQAGVEASLARNGASFAALSALKGMLGAIEGSSAGVGFQLELGDLVEPAYDAVDLAWRGFFAALALLGLYALALETGLLSLGLSVLGAAALLAGVGLLLPERRLARLASALRGLGTRTALFGAALAYGVPLVLLASQQVASSYLEPLRAKQAAKIEAAAPLLEQVGTRLRAIRERVSLLEPRQSLDAIARETRAIAAQASEIVLERARALAISLALLAVELLLLPLATGWLLLAGIRAAARAPLPRELR
jgi:hypothetical protein